MIRELLDNDMTFATGGIIQYVDSKIEGQVCLCEQFVLKQINTGLGEKYSNLQTALLHFMHVTLKRNSKTGKLKGCFWETLKYKHWYCDF